MQRLVIDGGRRLSGEIITQGAKNSALPILAAAFLPRGQTVIRNVPRISDTYSAMRILTSLGCRIRAEGNVVTVDGDGCLSEISEQLMREMRSSVIFLGAVLGKTGRCVLSYPGGCELGPRPIDMHISALKKMGAVITEEHGRLCCTADNGLNGVSIALPFPSVGATENIMLAAVCARGETVIKNCAREPEIADLAEFLRSCGADISGDGGGTIVINGGKPLHGCEYTVMPDRICAATWLSACAAAGGELYVKNALHRHLDSVLSVFEEMGCQLSFGNDGIYIRANKRLKAPGTVRTMVYPGFPTDMQAVVMAAVCKAEGSTVFIENIFENRFKHVGELRRMGADIIAEGKVAVVNGVPTLYGANVEASDLRGGAALAVAALSAEGRTELGGVKYIDRGYENIEDVLSAAGASVRRIG
ncbi:MAG: UDP-N-acetylglucosamine 1-carboxyvinyltransferase [Oscillospiraceae bacterium]|nr:UDP-N-acetylglucosamine 1-carboxyvinyltransferase [Oscillospiraceae bacterium]